MVLLSEVMFTNILKRLSVVLSLLHICVHCYPDLDFKVLQTFGHAQQPFVTSVRIPDGETPIGAHFAGIDRRIATTVSTKMVVNQHIGGKFYNVTGYIDADGKLGYTEFVLVIKFQNGEKIGLDGSLDVIGVRFEGKKGSIYAGRNVHPAYLEDCIVSSRSIHYSIFGESLVMNPRNREDLPKVISISCPKVSLDGEIAEFELET